MKKALLKSGILTLASAFALSACNSFIPSAADGTNGSAFPKKIEVTENAK